MGIFFIRREHIKSDEFEAADVAVRLFLETEMTPKERVASIAKLLSGASLEGIGMYPAHIDEAFVSDDNVIAAQNLLDEFARYERKGKGLSREQKGWVLAHCLAYVRVEATRFRDAFRGSLGRNFAIEEIGEVEA